MGPSLLWIGPWLPGRAAELGPAAIAVRSSNGLRAAAPAQPHREYLPGRAGIVGMTHPRLAPTRMRVLPGDLLIFATDGVRSDWQEHVRPISARHVVADVLARFGTMDDDALVLAARVQVNRREQ